MISAEQQDADVSINCTPADTTRVQDHADAARRRGELGQGDIRAL